jgi:hypothetical protein
VLLNLLAKIGLLWYEINAFSKLKTLLGLPTAPSPKLIGAGCFIFGDNKARLSNRPRRIGEFAVSSDEIPVSIRRIPCSVEKGNHAQRAGIAAQIDGGSGTKALKWSG